MVRTARGLFLLGVSHLGSGLARILGLGTFADRLGLLRHASLARGSTRLAPAPPAPALLFAGGVTGRGPIVRRRCGRLVALRDRVGVHVGGFALSAIALRVHRGCAKLGGSRSRAGSDRRRRGLRRRFRVAHGGEAAEPSAKRSAFPVPQIVTTRVRPEIEQLRSAAAPFQPRPRSAPPLDPAPDQPDRKVRVVSVTARSMDSSLSDRDTSGTKPRLPPSVTSFGLNLIALAVLLGTLYFLRTRHITNVDPMIVLMSSLSIPIVLVDILVLKVHRRKSTGLEWDGARPPDFGRVFTKLIGLALTVGLIALAYWSFPEYQGSCYDPLYNALRRFWISLVLLACFYVWFVDGLMREPRDAYWQLGRLVLGRFSDARASDIANHFRGWLVKAYFFPLMFVWLHNSVHELIYFDLTNATWGNLRLYDYLYTLVFGVDLLFTTAGYALSLRVIDTQIRTAEPTMFGWTVALFCYQPFFSLMERQYVSYGGNVSFGGWLEGWPITRGIWAAVIIALLATYSLATVAFGVRFSNLTNRGIPRVARTGSASTRHTSRRTCRGG